MRVPPYIGPSSPIGNENYIRVTGSPRNLIPPLSNVPSVLLASFCKNNRRGPVGCFRLLGFQGTCGMWGASMCGCNPMRPLPPLYPTYSLWLFRLLGAGCLCHQASFEPIKSDGKTGTRPGVPAPKSLVESDGKTGTGRLLAWPTCS